MPDADVEKSGSTCWLLPPELANDQKKGSFQDLL